MKKWNWAVLFVLLVVFHDNRIEKFPPAVHLPSRCPVLAHSLLFLTQVLKSTDFEHRSEVIPKLRGIDGETWRYWNVFRDCHCNGAGFIAPIRCCLFVLNIIISHYQTAVRTPARRPSHFPIISPDIIKPETTSLRWIGSFLRQRFQLAQLTSSSSLQLVWISQEKGQWSSKKTFERCGHTRLWVTADDSVFRFSPTVLMQILLISFQQAYSSSWDTLCGSRQTVRDLDWG